MSPHLTIDRERLADFCRRNKIRSLALFGSVLTDRFGPDSDVDVLVEYEPDAVITFIDMAGMEAELSEMIGRRVDLRTPAELSRYFRDKVIATAEVQYAA
jgi:predicted nucleotidyltransferase